MTVPVTIVSCVYGEQAVLECSYKIGLDDPNRVATSTVIYFIPGAITVPIANETPSWRAWQSETQQIVADAPSARGTVSQQVEEIQRITGFSDAHLAAAFPAGLTRETVNRWRNRPNPNLREENVYRLGLIFELARRMQQSGIEAPVWLHQANAGGETPYQLICQGRLGEVRQAVEAVAVGFASPTEQMATIPVYRERDPDIEGEDDEGWAESWDPDGDTDE